MGIEQDLEIAEARVEKAELAADAAQLAAQTLNTQVVAQAAKEIQEAKNEVVETKGDIEWLRNRVSELEAQQLTDRKLIEDLQAENLAKLESPSITVTEIESVPIPGNSEDSSSPPSVETVELEKAENPRPSSEGEDGLREAVEEVLDLPPPEKTLPRKKHRFL